jgi:hypothetical protein
MAALVAGCSQPQTITVEKLILKGDGGKMVELTAADIEQIRLDVEQMRLVACKEALRSIATALEMYSTDKVGYTSTPAYPRVLSHLEPEYLTGAPTCNGVSYGYECVASAFTVNCNGNHTGVKVAFNGQMIEVGPGYPLVSSGRGLVLAVPPSLPAR